MCKFNKWSLKKPFAIYKQTVTGGSNNKVTTVRIAKHNIIQLLDAVGCWMLLDAGDATRQWRCNVLTPSGDSNSRITTMKVELKRQRKNP